MLSRMPQLPHRSNILLVLLALLLSSSWTTFSSFGRWFGRDFNNNFMVVAAEAAMDRTSDGTGSAASTTADNVGVGLDSNTLDPDDPLMVYQDGVKQYPDIDEFYHHEDMAKKRKLLYQRASTLQSTYAESRKSFESREFERRTRTARNPPKFYDKEWEQRREEIIQQQRLKRFNEHHTGDEL